MIRSLALAILTLSSSAVAGDRIPVVQVRFSPHATRVMAVTAGMQDGSGFGAASVDVLNTTSGATLYRRTLTQDAPPNTVKNRLLAAPPTPATLTVSGLRPGVPSTPRYQRTYARSYPEYTEATLAGTTTVTPVALWTGPIPIKLTVTARPGACPDPDLLNGYVAAGFTLSVNGQVIHTDAALPAARRCTVGYAVDRVDVRGNRILVTVRGYSFGFEGPDARPVFVAATLR